MKKEQDLIAFEDAEIRRTWHNEEWWFVIIDVIKTLTDSTNPSRYVKDMRRRDAELAAAWSEITLLLSVETAGGKQRINCANLEGILRIIQSISSPKAEPFKRWLAQLGRERIEEIEVANEGREQLRAYYRGLGYSEDWINNRLQAIDIRSQLTDEWKGRGVKEGLEYAILTAEISKGTFGMTPSEYKDLKQLKKHNLRDHMSNLELIFTMLGEEGTRQQAIRADAKGFDQNKIAAQKGGDAAGKSLETYEKQTQTKVITDQNYLQQIKQAKEEQKRLKKAAKKDKE